MSDPVDMFIRFRMYLSLLDDNSMPGDIAKCQPTCRIFVISNLLCKFMGALPPKPPRYFYNGNGRLMSPFALPLAQATFFNCNLFSVVFFLSLPGFR